MAGALQQLGRNRLSVAGSVIVALLVAAAIFAPHLGLADPIRLNVAKRFTPPGAGSLLICSDGLWNYLAEAPALARLALPKALTDPLGAAADMVKFAVDAGGADNITVVLIPYLGPETP